MYRKKIVHLSFNLIFLLFSLIYSCTGTVKDSTDNSGNNTATVSNTDESVNIQIPVHKAKSISFTDSDIQKGELQGTVSITKAEDESDITDYVLYWGSDSESKTGTALTSISKTGENLSYIIAENTPIPADADYFLVYTKNEAGEMTSPVSTPIVEYINFPTSSWQSYNAEELGLNSSNLQKAADWAENNGSESFLVIKDGFIVKEEYRKGFDANTKKDVASVTKSLTSILGGILEDAGYMDIDDYAYNYGTNWYGTDSQDIKIVNLLGNNSGRYWDESADYTNWITELVAGHDITNYALGLGQQYVASVPVEVGTLFQYNNMAVQCLERVFTTALNNAGAGTLENFAQTKLLDPIGMTNTTYLFDTPGNMQMHAGARSTARDMARFGWLLLNKGNWNGKRIVSESYIERAVSPAIPELYKFYGLLFRLNGDTGNGYYYKELPPDAYLAIGLNGQIIIVSPSKNMVVIRQGEAGGSYNGENTKHLVNSLYGYIFNPIPPPLLISPTDAQTNTGDTPTFIWEDYSQNSSGEPWSYVLWLQGSGEENPAAIWGLPNTTTNFNMASPPTGKNKYDLFCVYTGGVWDGSSCSGGAPSAADLSAFSDWEWKVSVVECDYDKFINDDPLASPNDDYTTCAIEKLTGSTAEYLISKSWTLKTIP